MLESSLFTSKPLDSQSLSLGSSYTIWRDSCGTYYLRFAYRCPQVSSPKTWQSYLHYSSSFQGSCSSLMCSRIWELLWLVHVRPGTNLVPTQAGSKGLFSWGIQRYDVGKPVNGREENLISITSIVRALTYRKRVWQKFPMESSSFYWYSICIPLSLWKLADSPDELLTVQQFPCHKSSWPAISLLS